MDLHDQDLVAFFDEAPLWSAPFGAMALAAIDMRPGLTVLDIGAGTGFLSVELAQRMGVKSRIHALDLWPAALDRVRGKARYFGLPHLTCHEADAASMPFPDACFDVLVSNVGINNFSDPPTVAAECRRVAKPGAQLILTTNLIGHMQEFYDVYDQTLAERGMNAARERLRTHVAHRGTRASVTALIEDAGFVVESWKDATKTLRYVDGDALLGQFLIRFGFLPAWREVAGGEPAFDELRPALVKNLGGPIELTIPMACAVARKPTA